MVTRTTSEDGTGERPAEAVLRTRIHVGCGPWALKSAW